MSAEPTLQVDLFAPSLVEATTRRLRDEILSGALEPGSRLIEEQICQRFSISRAPLRESLRLLVQQGLVEHLPRRGARVTIWSEEDIRQLFERQGALVSRVLRVSMGSLKLDKSLARGQFRQLEDTEVQALLKPAESKTSDQ